MVRVLAITVALSAVFFVALARPQEETAPEAEVTTAAPGEGEATTLSASCAQYEEQCKGGQGNLTPVQSGIGGGIGQIPGVGGAVNQTQGQLPLDCKQMEQACGQGGNNGLTPPPNNQPPAMNGSVPNAEIPGVGGMNNLTGAAPTNMPIQLPIGK